LIKLFLQLNRRRNGFKMGEKISQYSLYY